MSTPMDQFMVGQFVMQDKERTWKAEAGGLDAMLGGTATIVERHDRSYMYEPFEIIAIDLPKIVLRRTKPLLGNGVLHTSIVDLREFDMRLVPREFVEAYLAGHGVSLPTSTTLEGEVRHG